MGCVSSKIMTKSASFREEFNRSMRRRTNSIEEIFITKNSGDQFVAVLCTAQEPNKSKNLSVIKYANSNPSTKETEKNNVETINTWELLDGLEDDSEGDEHQNADDPAQIGPSRSFRTVEDYDAMVAASQTLERSESSTKHESVERDVVSEKGSKRRAMAKELSALKLPGFEFTRAGSLREWLSQGGQVFSPGSYTTPKFGNFVSPGDNNGDANIVFDPELVEHFEQAMEQLTMEEESIIKEIIESLESGGNEE